MLSRKKQKQLAISLALTIFFAVNSVVYAENSGGDYVGINYVGKKTEGSIVNIDENVLGSAYGGKSDAGNAKSNTVNVSGGTINSLFGGYSDTGNAISNTVNISGGTIAGYVIGGQSATGTAQNNTVNISGGKMNLVYGGGDNSRNKGAAQGNVVNISGGEMNLVVGAQSDTGSAISNTVNISGGKINKVYGGATSDTGNATSNVVNISGGKINADVIAGWSSDGNAINNTLKIQGNPIFSATTIYGGGSDFPTGDVLTGNKLQIYRSTNTTGIHTVKGVKNFATIDFYLDSAAKNGDTLLKVTDAVDLSKTTIGLDLVAGENPKLVVGNEITLISSIDNLDKVPASKTIYAGLEKIYGFDFIKKETALNVRVNKAELNQKVQSMPTAQKASHSMINIGGDMVVNQGMTAAFAAVKITRQEILDNGEGSMPIINTTKTFENKSAVFATIGGGSSKYKTGGSSDVEGFNLMTGMAWRIKQPKNNSLLLGAFFEGGWGSYTTNSSFAEGNVQAEGKSDYMGGGILGRYEFASGTYIEGSVRVGRASNDYSSRDLRNAGDARVGYDTSNNYNGAHLGLGFVKKINEQTELDFYGKYLYTHQAGSNVVVVGDNIQFDPSNSHRLHLGARVSQKNDKAFNCYAGLAYEYEFDGKMNSSINYNPILAPSAKGATGILELGVVYKPMKNKNLSMDLSINGYAGQRQGVAGNLQLKYLF